jgi:1-deoxy-D-xylulose-5-phosphate synthase
MNEEELRNLMYTASMDNMGPFAIRYPRGQGVMPEWKTELKIIEVGTGRKLRVGQDIAILSIGHIGNYVTTACDQIEKKGIYPAHYDMRFAKPLDEKLLHKVFSKYNKIITIEDGCIIGGLGSAIIEFMIDKGYYAQVKRLGIPDRFIDHGSQHELHKECGYDTDSIVAEVQKMVGARESLKVV